MFFSRWPNLSAASLTIINVIASNLLSASPLAVILMILDILLKLRPHRLLVGWRPLNLLLWDYYEVEGFVGTGLCVVPPGRVPPESH